MMFLPQSDISAVVDVKLTNKGKELLANGESFKIIKFAFGDTEVNYQTPLTSTFESLAQSIVARSMQNAVDIQYKLYSSGLVPTGEPILVVSSDNINVPFNNTKEIAVYTTWYPVLEPYVEEYKWINLGPMIDGSFRMVTSNETRVVSIRSLNVKGSTTIKVVGMISGSYRLVTVNFGSE